MGEQNASDAIYRKSDTWLPSAKDALPDVSATCERCRTIMGFWYSKMKSIWYYFDSRYVKNILGSISKIYIRGMPGDGGKNAFNTKYVISILRYINVSKFRYIDIYRYESDIVSSSRYFWYRDIEFRYFRSSIRQKQASIHFLKTKLLFLSLLSIAIFCIVAHAMAI